jgi:cation:H+ antiporter
MMIQATVPSALGILFTPWIFDRPLLIAAGITALSIAAMWVLLRRGLLRARGLTAFGLLYLVFVGLTML